MPSHKANAPGVKCSGPCSCAGYNPPTSTATLCGSVYNYCVALAGFTVRAIQAGAVVATATTDASGHFCLTVPSATATTLSVAGSGRYGTTTAAVSAASIPTGAKYTAPQILMNAAPGYSYLGCCATDGGVPIPATLHLTDSVYGNVTLSAIGPTGGTGTNAWQGSIPSASFAACNPCPAQSGIVLSYALRGGCALQITVGNNTSQVHPCPLPGTVTQVAQTFGWTGTSPPLNITATPTFLIYCNSGTITVTE